MVLYKNMSWYQREPSGWHHLIPKKREVLKVQSSFVLFGVKSKGNVITLDGISFSVFNFMKLKEEIAGERKSFLTKTCGSKHTSFAV